MQSPPATPSRPPPGSPEPHEYNAIIHAIQRRSVDRASSSSDSLDDSSWRVRPPPAADTATLIHDLESDLRLSAQVGSALLESTSALEKRLATSEGANQKLLDRLTSSVKESSQLQRRLEEAVGNLEQAESNNRALLVALEEDRKKISRLSTDGARLATSATQLKNLTRAHEDTNQELMSEQKRAQAAELRVKKQGERVGEMEDRLRRAIEDLEEMRQDKVLRTRKSHDALAKVRAKFAASVENGELMFAGLGENAEAAELLKLVESLVRENDMLRSESAELHELLDLSRDEQSGLRSAIANQGAFAEQDDDEGADDDPLRLSSRPSANQTLLSEVLLSPSVSHSFSDFERPSSPASTNPTSFARSWGPSSNLSSRALGLARTNSSRSVSPGPANEEPTRHTHFHYHLPEGNAKASSSKRKMGSNTLGHSTGSGRVPFGRGHVRRTMSLDVSEFGLRRASGDFSKRGDSAVGSPPQTPYSPAMSIGSSVTDDDAAFRPRRHHRPLSLSLGPSLFPLVPEDGQSTPAAAHPRYERGRHSQSMSVSTFGDAPPPSRPSALSLSSPEQSKRKRQDEDGEASGRESRVIVTVESSTQTSPSATPTMRISSSREGGLRSVSPIGFDTPPASSAAGLSEGERSSDFGGAFPPGGVADARTAVLGALIDHATKLLGRIQAADVTTLENRLKKHHLPGDVRHLAQSNLKDLVNDIEGLRTHFRRVLEQERTIVSKEGMSSENAAESLVLRRDFVSLVKLFRDLLFETSRLRSLVNRVQLDPSLAASLRELDALNTIDTTLAKLPAAPSAASNLLAPFSRLFASALSAEPEPSASLPPNLSAPRPSVRPIVKLTGSSAVTSATVNVEFGSGAVRRAVAFGPGERSGSPEVSGDSPRQGGSQGSISRKKSELQVRRDLSSIFVGGLPPPRSPTESSWVVLPPNVPRQPAAPSRNPFGRLISAAYRPAATMSPTTNAVLDSFAHAPQPDQEYQPTLLERQLRPRGLSDSSIRSTFIAHANPHHRLLSPATLALSSEAETGAVVAARPIPLSRAGGGGVGDGEGRGLKDQLAVLSSSSAAGMRRPSVGPLRPPGAGPSSSRSVSSPMPPPVPSSSPSLPISISASPSATAFPGRHAGSSLPQSSPPTNSPPPLVAGSLFGNLSNWASKAAGMSSFAGEGEEGRTGRVGMGPGPGKIEEWSGPGSLGGRSDSWRGREA